VLRFADSRFRGTAFVDRRSHSVAQLSSLAKAVPVAEASPAELAERAVLEELAQHGA
jgi:hypothetical protein